jgi:hypothetical protein
MTTSAGWTKTWTFLDGDWHEGNVPIMGVRSHAAWLGSMVFDGARVFTNKPPCGPKRGHGTPQPRFAMEVQLDKIACDLGLDPAEIRRRHLQPANSLTANFLRVGSIGLGACIDKVVAASGWKKRRGKLPPGRGLGIACSSYLCGAGLPIYWNAMPQSGVQLKIDRGGGVTVFCGSTEIGQGSDSILASIVAEVLGIDPLDIRLRDETDSAHRLPFHGDGEKRLGLHPPGRGIGDQRRRGDHRPVDALVAGGEDLQADGHGTRRDRVGDDERPEEVVPVIAHRDQPVGEVHGFGERHVDAP